MAGVMIEHFLVNRPMSLEYISERVSVTHQEFVPTCFINEFTFWGRNYL